MTIFTGTRRGGELDSLFPLLFTLIPHPGLVFVSSLFRILFLVSNLETYIKKD